MHTVHVCLRATSLFCGRATSIRDLRNRADLSSGIGYLKTVGERVSTELGAIHDHQTDVADREARRPLDLRRWGLVMQSTPAQIWIDTDTDTDTDTEYRLAGGAPRGCHREGARLA